MAIPERIPPLGNHQYMIIPALLATPPVVASVLTNRGFCLRDWIPYTLVGMVAKMQKVSMLIASPLLPIARLLPRSWDIFTTNVILAPIVEEILCRSFIQELLFKRAPVMLLQEISPKLATCVKSSTYAKVTRVALSSLLFALAHLSLDNCSDSNRPIDTIGVAVLLGVLVEVQGPIEGLLTSTLTHASFNLAGIVAQSIQGLFGK